MLNRLAILLLCLTGCAATSADDLPSAAVEEARRRLIEVKPTPAPEPEPIGSPDTAGGRGDSRQDAAVPAPRVQFLLFTDPATCAPCVPYDQVTLPALRHREKWLIDHSADATIRVITPRDAIWEKTAADWKVEKIPMLCPLVNGVGKRSQAVTGFQTADQILALYRQHSGPQAFNSSGQRAFGSGANSRLASDWLTLPGLSFSLSQAALRVDSAQTLDLNEHFSLEFKSGCTITPGTDRITLTAPYPVARVKFLFSLEAALTGIKLDAAGRKATFELAGFPDKTFSF